MAPPNCFIMAYDCGSFHCTTHSTGLSAYSPISWLRLRLSGEKSIGPSFNSYNTKKGALAISAIFEQGISPVILRNLCCALNEMNRVNESMKIDEYLYRVSEIHNKHAVFVLYARYRIGSLRWQMSLTVGIPYKWDTFPFATSISIVSFFIIMGTLNWFIDAQPHTVPPQQWDLSNRIYSFLMVTSKIAFSTDSMTLDTCQLEVIILITKWGSLNITFNVLLTPTPQKSLSKATIVDRSQVTSAFL